MDHYDFDHPPDRRDSASLKWDKYASRDILPMWVADMDFPAPPAVLSALRERLDHGVLGYTLPPQELAAVMGEQLARRYNWQVEPQWLVWLPGLVTGLNVACRAVGRPGDGVLTTTPIYPPFLSAPQQSDRQLLTAPLIDNGSQWVMDFAALEEAVTPDTKLLLFCNPHNPTGRVYSRPELQEIAAFCQRHDLIICSDEIHCDLVLEPDRQHIPMASLAPEVADRCITLMAPSKTYNIPGLGASLAVIPNRKLRAHFQKVMAGIVSHVNVMGLIATLAAYRDCDAWLADLRAYLRKNRDLVTETINDIPGLSMRRVEATYLAWIDTRGAGITEPGRFFEAAGVGLSDGRDFGAAGFVRFNFGCSSALLRLALERMRQAK